jgi:uncharacterized protein YfcZ (UPF0381/DUF406 family)
MGSIADFVREQYAETHAEAESVLAKLDALAEELTALDPAEVALALAGVAKATLAKRQGAEVAKIIKQLIPLLLGIAL